jgi:stage V sporulation protein G
MNVTNVRVKKIENKNRLKAVATITFDDCFVVHELRLIEGKNGLFVAMPSKKNTQGEFRDVCHPINKELRQHIEDTVITAYHESEEEPVIVE